jgi:hypothetical protein
MKKDDIVRCKSDGSVLRCTGVVVDKLKVLVSLSFIYVESETKRGNTLTLSAADWARTQNFGVFTEGY